MKESNTINPSSSNNNICLNYPEEERLDDSNPISKNASEDKTPQIEYSQELNKFLEDNITKLNYSVEFFKDFLTQNFPEKLLNASENNSKDLKEIPSNFLSEQPQNSQSNQDILLKFSIPELTSILKDLYIKTPNNFISPVRCEKAPTNELNGKEIKVLLSDPNFVKVGLFETDYVVYEVETKALNWKVERRYNDFVWLRECLCKIYPFDYIPVLPKKKSGSKRFDEAFVLKRMEALQKFMDEIMKNEDFKSTEALKAFLYNPNRSIFEYNMYSKMDPDSVKINSIQKFCNINGSCNTIKFNEQSFHGFNRRFQSNRGYIGNHLDLNKNLRKELKNLLKNLENTSQSLTNVSKIFEDLAELNRKANLTEDLQKNYENLGYFFRNWGKNLINKKNIILDTLLTSTREIIFKDKGYSELYENNTITIEDYFKKNVDLITKKNKCWEEKKFDKWGINGLSFTFGGSVINESDIDLKRLGTDQKYSYSLMFTEESNRMNNLYYIVGMVLDKSNNAFFNYKRYLSNLLSKTMKEFSEKYNDTIQDQLTVWAGLISNIISNGLSTIIDPCQYLKYCRFALLLSSIAYNRLLL
ncbi:MAG: PX domain-containing protein, partial [archaeon]|nr:PX domain-containing protein [archaeon]